MNDREQKKLFREITRKRLESKVKTTIPFKGDSIFYTILGEMILNTDRYLFLVNPQFSNFDSLPAKVAKMHLVNAMKNPRIRVNVISQYDEGISIDGSKSSEIERLDSSIRHPFSLFSMDDSNYMVRSSEKNEGIVGFNDFDYVRRLESIYVELSKKDFFSRVDAA